MTALKPTRCSRADRYQGRRAPHCNNGQPCEMCLEKYRVRQYINSLLKVYKLKP